MCDIMLCEVFLFGLDWVREKLLGSIVSNRVLAGDYTSFSGRRLHVDRASCWAPCW